MLGQLFTLLACAVDSHSARTHNFVDIKHYVIFFLNLGLSSICCLKTPDHSPCYLYSFSMYFWSFAVIKHLTAKIDSDMSSSSIWYVLKTGSHGKIKSKFTGTTYQKSPGSCALPKQCKVGVPCGTPVLSLPTLAFAPLASLHVHAATPQL